MVQEIKRKIGNWISITNEIIAKHFYNRIIAKVSALIEKEGRYIIFRTVDSIDKWSEEAGNIVASPIKRETNYWNYGCFNSKDLFTTLEMYCGYQSEYINHFLRTNKPIHAWNSEFEIEDTQECISKIDSEMRKRNLHCNILAVRWVHINNVQRCMKCQLSEIKPGKICVDSGYMSTSLHLHYIGSYDNIAPRKISQEVLLLLKLPIGSNGIYIRKAISNRDEYEYIIDKGTAFLIEKVYHKFSRPFIIVCQIQNRHKL